MMDIDKRLKKLEKKSKPLKKFKYEDRETPTRLEPYSREKIDLRDIDDLIEDDEDLNEDN